MWSSVSLMVDFLGNGVIVPLFWFPSHSLRLWIIYGANRFFRRNSRKAIKSSWQFRIQSDLLNTRRQGIPRLTESRVQMLVCSCNIIQTSYSDQSLKWCFAFHSHFTYCLRFFRIKESYLHQLLHIEACYYGECSCWGPSKPRLQTESGSRQP